MSSFLGTLVVRIAAEMSRYKADINEAADATSNAAGKIEKSTGRASLAAGRMNGSMGEAVRGAEALHGAAGMAGSGIGLLAIGLAAAGYAAYKGAQEDQAYRKSLIMTGNAAGTTAGQMADMATAIGQNVGTQYQAAAALAAMAGTGQVAGSNLQQFAQVAVEMQRTVGTSVADTVKTFAELGQEPVKASMKLNESMNYLTASTFEQIKAAEDLGDKSKAASIAQDAYATAAKDRMTQIRGNLGILERAWNAVGYASKWAYDRMAGLGRDETDGQKLEAIKKRIANANKPFDPSAFGGNAEDRAQLPMLQAQAAALEGVAIQAQASAQALADKAIAEKAGIAAINAVTVANTKALTKQQQMTNALTDYRKSLEDIRAVDAGSKLLDPGVISQTEAAIKKQFETTVRGGHAAVTVYDRLLKSISEKTALQKIDLQTEGALSDGQKVALKVMDDLRTGTLKLTDAQKIKIAGSLEDLLVAEQEVKAHDGAAKAVEKALESSKKITQSYNDARVAAQAYIDTVNKQNAREVAGIGKGDAFRTRSAGIGAIEDKQTTQRQGLEGDLRRGQIDRSQFDDYLAIVNDTYAKEVSAYDKRTEDIKAKQADWSNGASEAFANYQSAAENVAANTAAMFSTAFEGMTNGVASSISAAILQGKSLEDSLRSVAMNVADAFITSFIKIQIQKLFIDKAAGAGYATTIAAQSQAMVAMAGLSAFASTAAIPIVGPVLAPAAAAAAVAVAEGFAVTATAAAALSIAGSREFGGPVDAGKLYQVNERGPEMLSSGGRDYLMMGSRGGSVTPNNKLGGGGGAITIINQTRNPIGKVTEQTKSNGDRAIVIEEAATIAVNRINAAMHDANSKTSHALSRNYSMQRSR